MKQGLSSVLDFNKFSIAHKDYKEQKKGIGK